MGKKGKWFGAVKKVFSPDSKKKKLKNADKSRKNSDPSCSEFLESTSHDPVTVFLPPSDPHPEEETDQSKAVPSAAENGASVTAEVIHRPAPPRFAGKSEEEIAAIKIQTAFRGYLARRALRALRGLVRLKSLIHGSSVKRQTTTTFRCMQTLARVQSQIRSRRVSMSEENQALQRQLLLKREKELEILRMGDEWDASLQSKEQIEASLTSKQEAALRRERALAYAFTHQGKNSSKSANPMFMDPNNPHWGWSWLERWMAARPWESRSTTDKDDLAPVKSAAVSVGGAEITKSFARRDVILEKTSPATQKSFRPSNRHSPPTPQSKPPSVAGKVNSASPRMGWARTLDDDTRSMISMKSDRRRHSIAGSSAGDDESLASFPVVPSYMTPTQSTRARSRFQSSSCDTIDGLDKLSVASAKKRLSFPVSPIVARRHSGPPKVDSATMNNVTVQ